MYWGSEGVYLHIMARAIHPKERKSTLTVHTDDDGGVGYCENSLFGFPDDSNFKVVGHHLDWAFEKQFFILWHVLLVQADDCRLSTAKSRALAYFWSTEAETEHAVSS